VVLLSRHRARGFDYSRPLWAGRHNPNFSGLARRVCLMLGFRHHHARSLTAPLTRNRLSLVGGPLAVHSLAAATAEAGDALELRRPAGSEAQCRALLAAVGVRQGAALSRRLLRAGAAHDGYRLVAPSPVNTPANGPDPGPTTLALHDAEASQWWALHTYPRRADAAEAAHALRAALLKLGDACEGLHLVEHLLLRPLDDSAAGLPSPLQQSGFFDLRLTAVLPNWTVRTHQHGFQLLAEETLRINCPVHLDLAVLWLDFDAMVDFETAYEAWLSARRGHCLAPDDAGFVTAERVDTAARRVIHHLLPTVATLAVAGDPNGAGDEGVGGLEEDG
jgi:hypothetical protein